MLQAGRGEEIFKHVHKKFSSIDFKSQDTVIQSLVAQRSELVESCVMKKCRVQSPFLAEQKASLETFFYHVLQEATRL